MLFADLLSLHLVTFLMFFYSCVYKQCRNHYHLEMAIFTPLTRTVLGEAQLSAHYTGIRSIPLAITYGAPAIAHTHLHVLH